MDYDSMEGLEYGMGQAEYGGLFEFINQDTMMEVLTFAAAGGAGLLAGTWGVDWLISNVNMLQAETETGKLWTRSLLQLGIGLVAGGVIYANSEPDMMGGQSLGQTAGMAIAGSMGALAIANIVNSMLGENKVALAEMPGDASLLSSYSDEFDGVAALGALEATGVSTAAGAFADPTVTNEALMGTIVQQEELGAYQPYMA